MCVYIHTLVYQPLLLYYCSLRPTIKLRTKKSMKLVNFLKSLRNEQVTIELKNGTTICGSLQTVSPQMNATLTDVTLSIPSGASSSSSSNNRGASALASVYLMSASPSTDTSSSNTSSKQVTVSLQYVNVRGNTIRQIILPDSLNLDSLLVDQSQLNRLRQSGKVTNESHKKRRREFVGRAPKRVKRGL